MVESSIKKIPRFNLTSYVLFDYKFVELHLHPIKHLFADTTTRTHSCDIYDVYLLQILAFFPVLKKLLIVTDVIHASFII
jgi:hypothetical protein